MSQRSPTMLRLQIELHSWWINVRGRCRCRTQAARSLLLRHMCLAACSVRRFALETCPWKSDSASIQAHGVNMTPVRQDKHVHTTCSYTSAVAHAYGVQFIAFTRSSEGCDGHILVHDCYRNIATTVCLVGPECNVHANTGAPATFPSSSNIKAACMSSCMHASNGREHGKLVV
jgi:hypothetical protein